MKRGAALAVLVLAAVSPASRGESHATAAASAPTAGAPTAQAASTEPPTSQAPTTTTTAVPLVPWAGPVEHLFFHTLIVRPDLAFTNDQLAQGFRDYFVTVGEFRSILDQLYANGWTLVDLHRAVSGQVMVPAGRKPLVISEDDVNYYDYSRNRGVGWRLVLDEAGNVKVEVRDDAGIRVTDEDLIPLIDQFVATHPLFSAEGAKGVIALTGYEGLFGERIEDPSSPDEAGAVARAKAIANRLRATGWTFASHSYGHIDLNKKSVAAAQQDIDEWLTEATPVIGPTDVFIYPFGAAPPTGSATVQVLRQAGFTIFCDIGISPRVVFSDGVFVMTRRHIDGFAFDRPDRQAPFFDVATVEDKAARGG